MSNRREAPRQKCFLQGRIYFNNRRSSVDCLVRELSEEGARVKFSEAITVPELVELHIIPKDETFRARVEWRSRDDAGLSFELDTVSAPGLAADADLQARVARLETEVATLQRFFRELQNERRQRLGAD